MGCVQIKAINGNLKETPSLLYWSHSAEKLVQPIPFPSLEFSNSLKICCYRNPKAWEGGLPTCCFLQQVSLQETAQERAQRGDTHTDNRGGLVLPKETLFEKIDKNPPTITVITGKSTPVPHTCSPVTTPVQWRSTVTPGR